MGERVKITGRFDTESIGSTDHYGITLYADISLRDLFAMSALNALIQADLARSVSHVNKTATDAYKFADAALAARKDRE